MSDSTRVALISGGARRVGRAIVERMAEAGYEIAFTYLSSADDAQQLTEALRARGRDALAIRADLTDPDSAASIHQQFTGHFARLDLLVNNASIYQPGDLRTMQIDHLRRMFAIHVEAPLLLAGQFEPLLRQAKGQIVNLVDILAERPWPSYLGYCATKAALVNLTLCLARELAPDVTVNGIAPGVVEWPAHQPPHEREKYLRRVPLGRAGSPRDVAETVHFLCTGGTYMTGQILRLDGGRSIT